MKLASLFIIIALGSIACWFKPESNILTNGNRTANTVASPPVIQIEKPLDEQRNSYRNDVNGVAIGSDRAEVIRQFGRLTSIKKGGVNPCGGNKSVLRYSGIEFTLDEDESKRNIVVVIEITSPNWNMTPGIRIGMDIEEIRSKMGRAGNYTNKEGAESLGYADGDGYLIFYLKKGKLVKIVRDLNQC